MSAINPTPTKPESEWADLRLRMQQSAARLQETITISPAEQHHILATRAAKLAQPEQTEDRGQCLELVEFCLADEFYAVECLYVQEVYPLKTLTPVPGVPAFVAGIVSIRGEIISVVDLKQFFDMPRKGLTDLTRVIILHSPDTQTAMTFGILAEEVTGTMSLPITEIHPPLPTLTGIRAEYLRGVANNRLIVLDAAKLLADKKIIVHQEIE